MSQVGLNGVASSAVSKTYNGGCAVSAKDGTRDRILRDLEDVQDVTVLNGRFS